MEVLEHLQQVGHRARAQQRLYARPMAAMGVEQRFDRGGGNSHQIDGFLRSTVVEHFRGNMTTVA